MFKYELFREFFLKIKRAVTTDEACLINTMIKLIVHFYTLDDHYWLEMMLVIFKFYSAGKETIKKASLDCLLLFTNYLKLEEESFFTLSNTFKDIANKPENKRFKAILFQIIQ